MAELELEGYDVASNEDSLVNVSKSVLELATHLIQFQLLTGDPIEDIWENLQLEIHKSESGPDKVLAPISSFEKIEALFNDPETQKRVAANMENLLRNAPGSDTEG